MEAKMSRGEALGRSIARLVKRLAEAEKKLIDRSGSNKRWVKLGLRLTKTVMVIALGLLSLWLLTIIVPFILLAWAMVVSAEESETVRIRYRDGTTSADYPAPNSQLHDRGESLHRSPKE